MSPLNHMLANSLWQCMWTMFAMARCESFGRRTASFQPLPLALTGRIQAKIQHLRIDLQSSLQHLGCQWKCSNMLLGDYVLLYSRPHSGVLSRASYNMYHRSKPLLGWESGWLNPSTILTKYKRPSKYAGNHIQVVEARSSCSPEEQDRWDRYELRLSFEVGVNRVYVCLDNEPVPIQRNNIHALATQHWCGPKGHPWNFKELTF